MLSAIARRGAAALIFSVCAASLTSACDDPKPPPCLEAGEDCGSGDASECCSGACVNGSCSDASCAALGEACGANMACCNGVTCMTDKCGAPCFDKAVEGEACVVTSDCCVNRVCAGGLCVFPKKDGEPCMVADECASGSCIAGKCSAAGAGGAGGAAGAGGAGGAAGAG